MSTLRLRRPESNIELPKAFSNRAGPADSCEGFFDLEVCHSVIGRERLAHLHTHEMAAR